MKCLGEAPREGKDQGESQKNKHKKTEKENKSGQTDVSWPVCLSD